MRSSNQIERFKYLFEQYTSKKCAENDRIEFLEMVAGNEYTGILRNLINHQVENSSAEFELNEHSANRILNNIIELKEDEDPVPIVRNNYFSTHWKSVAAVILIMLAGAAYWAYKQDNPALTQLTKNIPQPVENDLAPGKTGAILTLSNGQKIVLDSAGNGLLAAQGQTRIIKKNGQLQYSAHENNGGEVLYNTMTTPKGRKYQLVLSDGSKVWLNAASSITYPTNFIGTDRKVVISGEAFFDISSIETENQTSSRDKIPFIVETVSPLQGVNQIKVLGTQFNVGAYEDDKNVKTTLVEGSVEVISKNQSVIIKPGQVAMVQPGLKNIKVAKADVEEAIAWKEGFFNFRNADIETIMRQVARWYDVEIVYDNEIPKGHYRGEVSRDVNASEMLKVLELSGIRFNIIGKKIIVL